MIKKSNWTTIHKVVPKEKDKAPFFLTTINGRRAHFSQSLSGFNVPTTQVLDTYPENTEFIFSFIEEKNGKIRVTGIAETKTRKSPQLEIFQNGQDQFSIHDSANNKILFSVMLGGDLSPYEMYEESLLHPHRDAQKVFHLVRHHSYRTLLKEGDLQKVSKFLKAYYEACSALYSNWSKKLGAEFERLREFVPDMERPDFDTLAEAQISHFNVKTTQHMPEQTIPAPAKKPAKAYKKPEPNKQMKGQNKKQKNTKQNTGIPVF